MHPARKVNNQIKHFFRLIKSLCLVVLLIAFLEGLYFAWILNTRHLPVSSDAIIVFMGTEKRIEAGYELANKGMAATVILSPATDKVRNRSDRKYNLKHSVSHIPENQATTTFENALYTSRIITAHHWKTVTLVTSDYHMPRSFALLSLTLAGKNVDIRRWAVTATPKRNNSTRMKLIYNEMVEFWGSFLESARWHVTGQTTKEPKNKSQFVALLRSLILLDVNPNY